MPAAARTRDRRAHATDWQPPDGKSNATVRAWDVTRCCNGAPRRVVGAFQLRTRGHDTVSSSFYPPQSSTRALNAPFALDESKFHEPPARPGIVDRTELVERLHAAAPRPVL